MHGQVKNPIIRRKMRRKYTYNGIQFDSSPEIAYFIWLTDHQIPFIFHPNAKMYYMGSDGKQHYYEPDFLRLDTNCYEDIKGQQFFKPIFYKRCTERLQCIKDNNVRLILENEYKIYIDYCVSKFHDKNWRLQFKNT